MQYESISRLLYKLEISKNIENMLYEIYSSENDLFIGLVRDNNRVYCFQWINNVTLEEFEASEIIRNKCKSHKSCVIGSGMHIKTNTYYFSDGLSLDLIKESPNEKTKVIKYVHRDDSILSLLSDNPINNEVDKTGYSIDDDTMQELLD